MWKKELFKCTMKKISDILDPRAVLEEQGLEKGSGSSDGPASRLGARDFIMGDSKERIGLGDQEQGSSVTGNVRRLGLG